MYRALGTYLALTSTSQALRLTNGDTGCECIGPTVTVYSPERTGNDLPYVYMDGVSFEHTDDADGLLSNPFIDFDDQFDYGSACGVHDTFSTNESCNPADNPGAFCNVEWCFVEAACSDASKQKWGTAFSEFGNPQSEVEDYIYRSSSSCVEATAVETGPTTDTGDADSGAADDGAADSGAGDSGAADADSTNLGTDGGDMSMDPSDERNINLVDIDL